MMCVEQTVVLKYNIQRGRHFQKRLACIFRTEAYISPQEIGGGGFV
jgi:hypothetical protein